MAFYGLTFGPGDRILTARAEYASNVIAFLQVAARTGAVVEVIENDDTGQLSVSDLRRRLDDGSGPVKLVAITHVPTQGGLVNPAEEVGAATREAGVPYLLDACQSIGQMPVDVERIGCDLLSATGRKFLRGPRGTGFLYVRRAFIDQSSHRSSTCTQRPGPPPDTYEIRPDARRFENWETNYAAKIGLGVAVDYALSWGLEAIEARVTGLAERLREPVDERRRGARARPRTAPLRHRHLHRRRRPRPEGPAAALRQRCQRQRVPRRLRPPRPVDPRPARPGPRLCPLLQHRRRAGPTHRLPFRRLAEPASAPSSLEWAATGYTNCSRPFDRRLESPGPRTPWRGSRARRTEPPLVPGGMRTHPPPARMPKNIQAGRRLERSGLLVPSPR